MEEAKHGVFTYRFMALIVSQPCKRAGHRPFTDSLMPTALKMKSTGINQQFKYDMISF